MLSFLAPFLTDAVAAISNLLQDLELKPTIVSVGLLFAEHWVEVLRTTNGEFEDTMVNRSDVAGKRIGNV